GLRGGARFDLASASARHSTPPTLFDRPRSPNTIESRFVMKALRRPPHRKQRRGAALVEAALVLPVFVGVTLGIVEFGRAMMIGQLVTNAAREGARLAIIEGSTNSDVEASVR